MSVSVHGPARIFGHLFGRRRDGPAPRPRRPDTRAERRGAAGRIVSELADELPDEDLMEDLDDSIDLYRTGSKPSCEESEYLWLLRDARDRMERGG
ncbi:MULTISPECIES: hypothetical protein [Streptomyces]|uniref:hypothetical protein n=1 Tax=Streptomyces TaxID=1883 RepID=UPI001D154D15|nr:MULTISPECIES: hypothetical protein [Streptomyces]MCC3652254.1 hypothetical protein [Streptomyces sp. S07_1.15]WSQ73059.1 hypothetical protein OG463_17615 [Streptomyces xinghaiensis]